MWIVIRFPSGCCFALLRPDAVPFGFLRRFSRLFLMFLRPLGVLFGLLGALLEASWSLLGRSWAVLGRNWVVLGRLLGHFDFWWFFGAILGAKRVPKGRHFGSPNGAKIDQKTRCKFKSEKVTSWSRLGAILGRFPRRLGVKNVDFSLVFKGFRENPRFW